MYGSVTGGLLSFGAGIIFGWRVAAGGITGVAIGLLNNCILGICALQLTEKGPSAQPIMALGLYGRLIITALAATAVIFVFGPSPVLAFLAGLMVIQIMAVAVETRLRGKATETRAAAVESPPSSEVPAREGSDGLDSEGDDSNACSR